MHIQTTLWSKLKSKHFKQYTKYNNIYLKLITTWKAKPFQPYVSFTIEGNGVNLNSRKIFTIDSMARDKGHKSVMLLEM